MSPAGDSGAAAGPDATIRPGATAARAAAGTVAGLLRPAPHRLLVAALGALLLSGAGSAMAKTSHAGWPVIDGRLVINQADANTTLSGMRHRHNELLGGHGHDVLRAGRVGDVLWGDFKPVGQPTSQHDILRGGAGKDFIYAGHGRNTITSGGGADQIHAHFGHGTITCASPKPTVFLSHRSAKRYVLHGCPHTSFATVGH